ncbi:Uncharacterized protein AXF42_Ash004201 [Apostasia shenzhenica]|uniref:PWWP domain-containing protein n=1 Tax=Apostasia shenzhenica TaxID=1088818 RepID=A0A2I0A287_9ASPA|nr:Uncharacterized protein AXF42_Ash004201 [Apostasia shenzhenica]
MEICHGSDVKRLHSSAGSLVWVHRRNGSWWPGRVVSLDELPVKCLHRKNAGTPIKLLGRDEGTVDWYNLEKSKRIKAFRCGEYDDCIDRAKASAIRSNRRKSNSGKYVRREDAIIQALELENIFTTKSQRPSPSKANVRSCMAKNLNKPPKVIIKDREEQIYRTRKTTKTEEICTTEFSQSVISFENPDQPLDSAKQCIQKDKCKTPNDSEDDSTEGIKKMRDLQDLGLRMVSKDNMYATNKETHTRALFDCASHNGVVCIDGIFGNGYRKNCKRSFSYSGRTRVFHAYQNPKRRNCRRRSLTKVGLVSSKVSVPLVVCHESAIIRDLSNQKITQKSLSVLKSASMKIKFSSSNDSSLNCSGTSSEKSMLDVHEKNGTADFDSYRLLCTDDALDDGFSNGLVNVPVFIGERSAEGFSCTTEKQSQPIQVCLFSQSDDDDQTSPCLVVSRENDAVSNDGDESLILDNKGQFLRSRSFTELSDKHEAQIILSSTGSSSEKDFACSSRSLQLCKNLNSGNSSSYAKSKGALKEMFKSTRKVQELDKHRQTVVSDSASCPIIGISNSMDLDSNLYDVELKVQASYHRQRTPLVSLVSKLNGKAIVGHAIAVDVLDDGSSTALLCIEDRVPHVSCTSSPLLKRKLQIGRKSRFSPRKIRRLSSITLDLQDKENSNKTFFERVAGASTVSCIPIRVVFSRLNEALSQSSHPIN